MKLKINEDKFYTTTADTLSYYIENNGSTIFNGKAFKSPDEPNISINITKICRDYLKNQLPDFRGITGTTISQEEAYQSFSLYTYSASTEEAIPVLLETYDILYDWDYDLPWTGQSMTLSNPINGRMDKRMKLLYSVYRATTAETIHYIIRPSELIIVPMSFSHNENSGTTSFSVSSNTEYSVYSNNDWLSVSPSGGTEGYTLFTVNIDANPTFSARTGSISIDDKMFVVNQEEKTPTITITPPSYVTNNDSGSTLFTVRANVDYQVTSDNEWLLVSPNRGASGVTIFSVIYESNNTPYREGIVNIRNKQYKLIQDGVYITITGNTEIPYTQYSTNIYVSSNTEWDFDTEEVEFGAYYPNLEINLRNGAYYYYYPERFISSSAKNYGANMINVYVSGSNIKYVFDNYVTKIPNDSDGIFGESADIKSIIIPNSVIEIGRGISGCTVLSSITIPNSVRIVEDGAFSGYNRLSGFSGDNIYISSDKRCLVLNGVLKGFAPYSLSEYTLPNSVTKIGDFTFAGYNNLSSITIDDYASEIGDYAFSGCTNLSAITFGRYTETIGDSAFEGCTGLRSIAIPNSVTSIGDYAFSGCTNLSSVTIGNSVISIGEGAFRGCSFSSITIPNSVISIGEGAFRDCTNLNSIMLPNSVTSIGEEAFRGCTNLSTIVLPSGVTSFGINVFSGCTLLPGEEGITYSSLNVEDNILLIKINISDFEVKDGTKYICYPAFARIAARNAIRIPISVTYLGNYIFYYGGDNYIYYNGTKSQWSSIIKGEKWNCDMASRIIIRTVHCTDGDINYN